jgi:hypothetical protein
MILNINCITPSWGLVKKKEGSTGELVHRINSMAVIPESDRYQFTTSRRPGVDRAMAQGI